MGTQLPFKRPRSPISATAELLSDYIVDCNNQSAISLNTYVRSRVANILTLLFPTPDKVFVFIILVKIAAYAADKSFALLQYGARDIRQLSYPTLLEHRSI